jgi:hypothetical protein
VKIVTVLVTIDTVRSNVATEQPQITAQETPVQKTCGYWAAGMAIYQAGTARIADPSYFKHLTTWQPGTTKKIMGNVVVDQVAHVTYMVVRRSHRAPHTVDQIQRVGRVSLRAPRRAYHIVSSDYVIVRQAWADGLARELQQFTDAKAARDAFKQLTGRSITSGLTTVQY